MRNAVGLNGSEKDIVTAATGRLLGNYGEFSGEWNYNGGMIGAERQREDFGGEGKSSE